MKKSLIILLGLVFFLVGCGEKSTPLKSATFDLGNNTKNRIELHGSKNKVEKIINVETQTGIKKENIDKVKKNYEDRLNYFKDIKSMKYTQEIKDDTVITTHELDVSSKDKIKELVDSKQLPQDFDSLESISLEKTVEIFGKYGIELK